MQDVFPPGLTTGSPIMVHVPNTDQTAHVSISLSLSLSLSLSIYIYIYSMVLNHIEELC